MKNIDKKIRGYALKNALAYKGKAAAKSVISALFNEGLKKEDMKAFGKRINKVVNEVNSLPIKLQEEEFNKLRKYISEREGREGLSELPNVKRSGVIMRFSPSASGPMHIGHAYVAALNILYVKKYGGRLYLRIEDTNPDNVYPPSYKMLKEEMKWLSGNTAKVVIQSERIELYYNYIKKLIRDNHAYVCTCLPEDFREYSKKQRDCPCRELNPKENLERWLEMMNKEGFKPGEAFVRFRTPGKGMKHKNPAMRDFPLARVNETFHAIQKDKYRVWPLMNLAVAVDDIEMKITHIIRGKDHRDNSLRQELIFEALGKRYPWKGFLGRIHFKGLELSTTQFREAIETGKYKGWDDPKLPTLASLKKQGYKPKAFLKFAEQMGISEVDKVIDKEEYFRLLNHFNRLKE